MRTHHAPPQHLRASKAQQQWLLGQDHAKAGRWDAAARAHEAATQLQPADAVYALNHARALISLGRIARAGDEALRAFRLDPTSTLACELAAECLIRDSRAGEALQVLRSLGPNLPRPHTYHAMVGLALMRLLQSREAIAAFFEALAIKPDWAGMYHNIGLCFGHLSLQQEAAHCFNTAVILGAGKLEVGSRGLACFYERDACLWQESEAHLAELTTALRALPADSSLGTTPFAHIGMCADRADQLLAARSCARFMAAEAKPLAPCTSDWRPGGRRLRIGYVSADFHHHATAMLMAEMLEHHDRSRFEVRLYSHGASDASPMRARVEAACDEFVDVRALTDTQVAQRVRADGIDLLIDLKGHTRDSRLPIFAYRAAPLQVTFLGFPGTTGADYIDYLIGDRIVSPLAHADAYTEKIAQMPICYQPNDRQRPFPDAPSRASQGLVDDAFVLCSFNQPYKVSPEVFDRWCELLHALPKAVLWVLEWNPQALPNLKREAAARGIDPARLVGAARLHSNEHIARLRLADLFLDTWPCNAHTTASDALWAGVPIVTMLGETFAARVAASLLEAVGLPELICRDVAHYQQTVLALAADAPRLAALRARLDTARRDSPLFDSARHTRDIEALYLRMATRMAEGLPPEHLAPQGAA